MSKELIERLRELAKTNAPDTTCEEAANTIARLQAELVQKAADAEQITQWHQDALRQNVELRARIRVLEKALETVADEANKALKSL